MWRAHVSTKTRGTEDCKEFLLTEPTKRYKHVTAACTCTCSLLLYCTSRQSNLMVTRKYFWQPSRLKPCLSCLNMVPSVSIRTCFWKFMVVQIPNEASLKTAAGRSYKNMIISDRQNLFHFRCKLRLNGKVSFWESGTNCHFFPFRHANKGGLSSYIISYIISSLYRLQTIANPNALNNIKYDTLVFIRYNIIWRKEITVLSRGRGGELLPMHSLE